MFHSVRTRIIATFAAVLAVAVAVAAVGGIAYVRWQVHEVSDERGLSAARECATIGAILIDGLNGIEPNSREYAEDREMLRTVCRNNDMDYLYLYRCDTENDIISYLICVADDDVNDERVARERGLGTVVNRKLSENERRALAGEDVEQALVLDNEFGNMLAWFSVVPGTDGKVLAGADYSVSEQRVRVFNTLMFILVPFVIALLVVMVLQLCILQRHVFKPLHAIAGRMRTFSAEHASEFEPMKVASRDEMGEIADAFAGMAANIGTYVDDIERLTAERVQADVELDVARRIQLGMVPERCELAGAGFEACALSRAARSVGGDFYDVFEIEDGRVAAVVGDVSGKGVAAALFMAMTKTMVHDGLAASGGPAEVLNRMNDQLCASNPEGMFVTVFACVLDPATGEVRFANAGHLPPLVVGECARRVDAASGVLLGLFEDVGLEEDSLVLGAGECLLTFTDGVTEAVNAERAFFGDDALVAYVSAGAPYGDANSMVDDLVSAVDAFAAGCEQFDDLTVVALRRVPAGSGRVLPVDIASFAFVRDEILEQAGDGAAGRKACLACEEAFANIVSHSGATCIWFSVAHDGGNLKVTFSDNGAPFDPLSIDIADRTFDDLDSGGMGLGLIRSLATRATYNRTDSNILTLIFET